MRGFAIGSEFDVSSRGHALISLKYTQEPFGRLISFKQITVSNVAIPEISTKIFYDLYQHRTFNFGISGLGAVNCPGTDPNSTIRLGISYGSMLYLSEGPADGERLSYRTELGFMARSQDTNLSHQTERIVSLGLGIGFGSSIQRQSIERSYK